MEKIQKIINVLFCLLFFTVPLIFFPKTSELFEFNKIVVLYSVTSIVLGLWGVLCIIERKLIIRKTSLDIPILIFLASQIVSTFFSIDQHTSIFGYYSRWNGGLLSSICYSLLFWAYVTFGTKDFTIKIIKILLIATLITCIWASLEHFGHSPSCLLITGHFDVDCWVQDVKLRVFSTFGQPNWLAAWLVAILPFTWGNILVLKIKDKMFWVYMILSALFFATLLFTKSKSGILAFGISFVMFWGFVFVQRNIKVLDTSVTKIFLYFFVSLCLVSFLFGTPYSMSFSQLIDNNKAPAVQQDDKQPSGTSLESGGTDSGAIRKIVWSGALNVWKIYPLTGSGVETFAFSYYQGREMAHNMTSEWNFIYNKAHNEYLNYLATTGIVGLGAYIVVIVAVFAQFFRSMKKDAPYFFSYMSLFSGYVSILITNFFGFSVVPVSLLFFLFPAMLLILENGDWIESYKTGIRKHTNSQVVLIFVIIFTSLFLLLPIINYWRADYFYTMATVANGESDMSNAIADINKAISLSPNEPLYTSELGGYLSKIVRNIDEADKTNILLFTNLSNSSVEKSMQMSPFNINVLKESANTYNNLGGVDSNYYLRALDILGKLERLAPTDPSVWYQKGLTFAKLGQDSNAIETISKAIAMKPDYKIARRLLAFLYENNKENKKASEELRYILKYISPNDPDITRELQKLK